MGHEKLPLHIVEPGVISRQALYGNIHCFVVVVVVVVYFIVSRLLYLAFSANLGLLCMPHPGKGPLV